MAILPDPRTCETRKRAWCLRQDVASHGQGPVAVSFLLTLFLNLVDFFSALLGWDVDQPCQWPVESTFTLHWLWRLSQVPIYDWRWEKVPAESDLCSSMTPKKRKLIVCCESWHNSASYLATDPKNTLRVNLLSMLTQPGLIFVQT